MSFNFVIYKINNIYEQIYDLLEENNLNMNNINHNDLIKNQIDKFTKSHSDIVFSDNFNTKDEMFENLMINITNNDIGDKLHESLQGNTLLSFATDDEMYELVYLENINVKYLDSKLNQLASMSNIELEPIYGTSALLKTTYENGNLINKQININDITKLIIWNFYHSGVMINTDETMLELLFPGDNPNITIGKNFKQLNPINIFGLVIVGYNEENNFSNKLASALYGIEIKGRVYITTLCPITNKKFWNITIITINNILKLLADTNNDKLDMINKELMDDKFKNPFFLIKKYCVL